MKTNIPGILLLEITEKIIKTSELQLLQMELIAAVQAEKIL